MGVGPREEPSSLRIGLNTELRSVPKCELRDCSTGQPYQVLVTEGSGKGRVVPSWDVQGGIRLKGYRLFALCPHSLVL